MRKDTSLVISCLFFFFWFSCLTSQSLMDLSDFLMLLAGVYLLVCKALASKNWKLLWPRTTGLEGLWLAWFVVLAVGLFLNNPVNKDTIGALLEFRWMITFQILCFTLSWINWDQKQIQTLLGILLVLVGVSFVMLHFSEDPRAGGLFLHSMPFAHSYGTAFVFVSSFVIFNISKKTKFHWLAVTTATATAIIVVLSMTRGVWLGMTVAVMCISLLAKWRQSFKLILGLGLIFGLTLALSNVARERAITTNSVQNESDNQRKALWLGNFEIIKDYPLFGSGYSQNRNLLRKYYDKLGFPPDQFISHAHNEFLHVWAGTGTLGLICYLAFLGVVLRMTVLAYLRINPTLIIPKAIALGSLGAQICFIVASLTESNFSIAKNRYIFLLLSALGVSIYYRYVKRTNYQVYESLPLKK